jgi:hypothetical protein
MILETPLEDYNIMLKKLIKSKQLYVFGNVSWMQRKGISKNFYSNDASGK